MLLVEALHGVGECGSEQSTWLQVLERAAEERLAACSSEQLQRLHRHDDERELATYTELPRVRTHRLDRHPGGAAAKCGEQAWSKIKRDHLDAPGGKLKRDTSRTGAHVQYRPTATAGKGAPQHKIVRVPATLEVVPDRVDVHRSGSSLFRSLRPSRGGGVS